MQSTMGVRSFECSFYFLYFSVLRHILYILGNLVMNYEITSEMVQWK